ncbi:hypothetical protein [Blastopirellula marina]|uniref:Uncharacterized protein n=1 Tax=Blastopirellula marina TaxID=124 RepID=A0A2S8GMW7_9BACT|nr:hypothetical protein [Blastopirellula marina]PQO45770.1 hypothetical protein C5Y93_12650 [Blastopirellula marina]
MHDLNHPKVKPFTREIASALSIDQSFTDFVFAKNRPDCFQYWVEDVNGGWTCYVPDEFDAAYPLWSTNADQTVILVSDSAMAFGKGWHDNPEMEMISATPQGLLTYLVIQLAESGSPDAELRQAADFCGYKYLDDLLAFIDLPTPDSTWSEVTRQFIAAIDAKAS